MRPFLEQNGFAARKLASLPELRSNVAGLSGAIISLAVESPVKETVETVFTELRKAAPKVPVLFAAMLTLDAMKGALRRLARSKEIEATILGIDVTNDGHADLGKPDTFLYLCNADFSTPAKRALAAKIIQQHFR